jgi:hypothetical protein
MVRHTKLINYCMSGEKRKVPDTKKEINRTKTNNDKKIEIYIEVG